MENQSKKVVINVTKNARDESVLNILYDAGNGLQSPFNMDEITSKLATKIARKSRANNPNFIYLNPYTKKEVFHPDFRYNFEYCISGTDGDPHELLDILLFTSKNKDIETPLYIVSGEKAFKLTDEEGKETYRISDRIKIEEELIGPIEFRPHKMNH